jgi:hypothetical protein
VPASGAIHRRIEHGTPRQGPLGLRPGWSIPQLDGRRLTAGGRGRCAACEPNRRCNRFTSKEVNAVPMPTSSAGAEAELMKTLYDAHVFTVAAT